MSARAAASRNARSRKAGSRSRARRRRGPALRRRLTLLGMVIVAAVVAAAATSPFLDRAVDEIALPLRHDDIIRQQAADKDLDPALIAAVIYAESRFRDQTSPAGAKGLMQIMPETADYIAHKSGGTAFEQGDLATPQINIAYGSWYLKYLLDKYGGNELLSLAAYNAGEGIVDEWWVTAQRRGEPFTVGEHIPFTETRDYVRRVLTAREAYRVEHARALGI
jgi:soluble lytic murein transglycosylase